MAGRGVNSLLPGGLCLPMAVSSGKLAMGLPLSLPLRICSQSQARWQGLVPCVNSDERSTSH